MKYNEAQHREIMSDGVGSLSLSLEVLVLIALAKLAGPILAVVWVGLCVWGAVLHYRRVSALEDSPALADFLKPIRIRGRHDRRRAAEADEDRTPEIEASV